MCFIKISSNLFINRTCPSIIEAYQTRKAYVCDNVLAHMPALTIDITENVHTDLNFSELEDRYCVFESDSCGKILWHANGAHLMSCKQHSCTDKYFKCTGYYCIPWRYVCDNKWDCPGGTDEMSCVRASCPGQFKCLNSVTCVDVSNTCDNVIDCWHQDDEWLCLPRIPECPLTCTCSLLTIVGQITFIKKLAHGPSQISSFRQLF